MPARIFVMSICLALALLVASPAYAQFKRGDANDDGVVSMFDVHAINAFLFAGGALPCLNAADVNDDEIVDATDPVFLLSVICLVGGPAIPAPGPIVCGPDPTPGPLGCATYTSCGVVSPPAISSRFTRGDCDTNLAVNLADVLAILVYLFAGGSTTCLDACDVDDDSTVALVDAVYLANFLFLGGPVPPPPFPGCACDPTEPDGLDCVFGGGC